LATEDKKSWRIPGGRTRSVAPGKKPSGDRKEEFVKKMKTTVENTYPQEIARARKGRSWYVEETAWSSESASRPWEKKNAETIAKKPTLLL